MKPWAWELVCFIPDPHVLAQCLRSCEKLKGLDIKIVKRRVVHFVGSHLLHGSVASNIWL
jgi:hypothetical protein